MALKATIYKVCLQIADMDRNYYQDHNLTLARHPSETDERLMVRLLAFAINAAEQMQFTKGLSTDDEPDLWQFSLTGEIQLWIDVGLPEENRIRKACSRAEQVILYCYGGRGAQLWWERTGDKLLRFDKLQVFNLSAKTTGELSELAQRSMELHCTIQDGHVCLGNAERNVMVELEQFK